MSAGYQNLYLEQGTTFNTTITLDDVYQNAYNLSGYTAKSMMRYSYYAANATAVFSTSIDAANGIVGLSLSAANTANITPGRYVYDTIIKDVSGNVTRVLEGIVDVSPCVTR
jgi:hypothetical protein